MKPSRPREVPLGDSQRPKSTANAGVICPTVPDRTTVRLATPVSFTVIPCRRAKSVTASRSSCAAPYFVENSSCVMNVLRPGEVSHGIQVFLRGAVFCRELVVCDECPAAGRRGHPVLVIRQRRSARPPPDADGDGEFLCRVGRPEKLGAFRRTSFAAGKTPIICRDLSHVLPPRESGFQRVMFRS